MNRYAIRISFLILVSFPSTPALPALSDDSATFDLLCQVTKVTADGQESDEQGIRVGFLLRAGVPLPGAGVPPSGTSTLSPTVKRGWWDLATDLAVRYVDVLGGIEGGLAGRSRLSLDNALPGQGSDAVDGESYDYELAIGSTEVNAFSFLLLDPDGEALDTHAQFPARIEPTDWPIRECYIDGTNSDTQALVQATGEIRFGAMRGAQDRYSIDVVHGDENGLVHAIEFANLGDSSATTEIVLTGDSRAFEFFDPYGYSENALPVITSPIRMHGPVRFERWTYSVYDFRLASVSDGGRLTLTDASIEGFSTTGSGGAIRVTGQGALDLSRSRLLGNSSNGDGCDIFVDVDAGDGDDLPPVRLENNHFQGSCDRARIAHTEGTTVLAANTIENGGGEAAVRATDRGVEAILNVFVAAGDAQVQTAGGKARTEDLCKGTDDIESLGYNIATDASCALDRPGDLPNTDPLLAAPDEDGLRAPSPGSPAIDLGPDSLVENAGAPALPCGWVDIGGLGRPQDGDGDGHFECDAGAVEVQGAGVIQPGHSGAWYNSLRNGEGEYVEVLENGRTVIYTFTYNPAGDGAAWFIGVGNVVGNSLVTEDLLQPSGTAWGDDFDSEEIDFADWGGMSMVFPGCATGEPPGNAAFSGNSAFEPLLTAAERLTDVFGCGAGIPPHANAGLSGSFYDPTRNGEGLVVQYLRDGRVLAIMFTFGPDGDQIWLFGQAMADDKSVTMEVFYPTAFTAWGADFDPQAWALSPWGTWTLTWTDCDTLSFDYASDVQGYGSGIHQYTRLTSLLSGQCPEFRAAR